MEPPIQPDYYVEPRYQIHTLTLDEFKDQCLDFVAKIAAAGNDRTIEVIIFDGDEPVAFLTRYEHPPDSGVPPLDIKIVGDIVSPMPPEWFAIPDTVKGSLPDDD